jgi:hypothetical protein
LSLSIISSEPEPAGPSGVAGWLLLLVLKFWLNAAVRLAVGIGALLAILDLGGFPLVSRDPRLAAASINIAAGLFAAITAFLLVRKNRAAPLVAKVLLLGDAGYYAWSLLNGLHAPPLPVPASVPAWVKPGVFSLVSLVWLAYLLASQRVKNTYASPSPATPGDELSALRIQTGRWEELFGSDERPRTAQAVLTRETAAPLSSEVDLQAAGEPEEMLEREPEVPVAQVAEPSPVRQRENPDQKWEEERERDTPMRSTALEPEARGTEERQKTFASVLNGRSWASDPEAHGDEEAETREAEEQPTAFATQQSAASAWKPEGPTVQAWEGQHEAEPEPERTAAQPEAAVPRESEVWRANEVWAARESESGLRANGQVHQTLKSDGRQIWGFEIQQADEEQVPGPPSQAPLADPEELETLKARIARGVTQWLRTAPNHPASLHESRSSATDADSADVEKTNQKLLKLVMAICDHAWSVHTGESDTLPNTPDAEGYLEKEVQKWAIAQAARRLSLCLDVRAAMEANGPFEHLVQDRGYLLEIAEKNSNDDGFGKRIGRNEYDGDSGPEIAYFLIVQAQKDMFEAELWVQVARLAGDTEFPDRFEQAGSKTFRDARQYWNGRLQRRGEDHAQLSPVGVEPLALDKPATLI